MSGATSLTSVTAFAPATVANVAVGFDVLGFALQGVGDRITVSRDANGTGVTVESITGLVLDLPREPERNTASVALLRMVEDLQPSLGLRVRVHKGIPLGSGMGGSAASAVGAVVAADALLQADLSESELLRYALVGEQAASGAAHADNAAPCLRGGLTAVVAHEPLEVVSIPPPPGIVCVLVHPELRVETREARASLAPSVDLGLHVGQTMKLCGFLVGCFRGDAALVGRSMEDLVVEPQRAARIPGFARARAVARERGALGFGIAGSGPSVFAWAPTERVAREIEPAIRGVFTEHGLESQGWIAPIRPQGAEVVSGESG
jgi:homoserine kinase